MKWHNVPDQLFPLTIILTTCLVFLLWFLYMVGTGKGEKKEFWLTYHGYQEITSPFGKKMLIISTTSLFDGSTIYFPVIFSSNSKSDDTKKILEKINVGENVIFQFEEWHSADWRWTTLAITSIAHTNRDPKKEEEERK